MSPKQWVYDPDSGGVKIPEVVKYRTKERIRRYAEAHFAGRYTRLNIRFRSQFVTLMLTRNLSPSARDGRRQIRQRVGRNIWNAYGIHRRISAVCATLGTRSVGALPFTAMAVTDTSCRSFRQGSSLARQKRRSEFRLRCISEARRLAV